jgi:predicted nuclease with TOPRIM domain
MSAVGISPEEAEGLRANVIMALTQSMNEALEKLNDSLNERLNALGEKIDGLSGRVQDTAVALARVEMRVSSIERNCDRHTDEFATLSDRVDAHHTVITELSGQKKILRVLVPVTFTGVVTLIGIWLRGWLRGKGLEVGGP